MGKISYEIAQKGTKWTISRNTEAGAEYATAEGAFEVVAAQASIEMRSDNEIFIHVRPAVKGEEQPTERP
jgi:hypothetical protein